MGVNISQNVQNPAVFAGLGFGKFRFRVMKIPPHLSQNLQEQAGAEDLMAITLSDQFFFKTGAEGGI